MDRRGRVIGQYRRSRQECQCGYPRRDGMSIPKCIVSPAFGETPILSVAFGAIVGGAEHFAVLSHAFATLAPCGNVVRVHFLEPKRLDRPVPFRVSFRDSVFAIALAYSKTIGGQSRFSWGKEPVLSPDARP